MLDDHLAGRPTRANFRAGSLTVCTMVPMRSVPHRVVCLLGLDDGVFPRQRTVDGDDVLARTPVTGERDVRSEDRQLLLDAIGAATETLVVTYTGADPHSGQDRPPAVPLGELLDALDRTTEAPVRGRHRRRAPAPALRPAQRRAGPARHARRRSPSTRRCWRPPTAATGPRPAPPPFLVRPLAEPVARAGADDIALADLVTFFRDPVKGFFRALDLTLPWDVDGVDDAMPVEIDQLETWGVGDRMLADMLRWHPPRHRARDRVAPRRAAARPARLAQGHRGPRDRDEPRGRGAHPPPGRAPRPTTSTSTCPAAAGSPAPSRPVYGDRLVAVGYSRLDGKHLLESWVRLLALAAGHPDHNWTALTIGRAPRGTQAAQRLLGPTVEEPLDAARRTWSASTTRAGARRSSCRSRRRSPGPPRRTSGQDPKPEALKKWRSSRFPGEDADPAHVRVWGEHADLDRPRPSCPALARAAVVPAAARASGGRCDDRTHTVRFDLLGPAAQRARPRPCSRPAPAPARPTRSPRLVTRYVAEGGALLDDMLLITFSRAASQELRERVRDQLVRRPRRSTTPPGPTTSCSPTWSPAPTTSWPTGAATCATRWPASTPRPSRPPTSSASWCCARSASPATPTPASPWSRTSTSWSPRSSTTSTSSASAT